LSIPRELALGYVGLLLFMMGDGVESGYLAHFLHGEGISPEKIALLFTVYGALAAIGGPLFRRLIRRLGTAFGDVDRSFSLDRIPGHLFGLLAPGA
jgi:predicted MFS family arabinose efflux permease